MVHKPRTARTVYSTSTEKAAKQRITRQNPGKAVIAAMHRMAPKVIHAQGSKNGTLGLCGAPIKDQKPGEVNCEKCLSKLVDTPVKIVMRSDRTTNLIRQGLVCCFNNHGAGGCSDPKCPTRVIMQVDQHGVVHSTTECEEFFGLVVMSPTLQQSALNGVTFCADCEVK